MSKYAPLPSVSSAIVSCEIAELMTKALKGQLGHLVITQDMVGRTMFHEGRVLLSEPSPSLPPAKDIPTRPTDTNTAIVPHPVSPFVGISANQDPVASLRQQRLTFICEFLKAKGDTWTPVAEVVDELLRGDPDLERRARVARYQHVRRCLETLATTGEAYLRKVPASKGVPVWSCKVAK